MPPQVLDQFDSVLVWFRRDLRLDDHTALSTALKHAKHVHAAFVFDTAILAKLPRQDRRVAFIHASLHELDAAWRERAANTEAGLLVRHGEAIHEMVQLAQHLGVQAVFTHHDDEPEALARDAQVRGSLANHGIAFHSFKDHVVFERSEVLTLSGTPYGCVHAVQKRLVEKSHACRFSGTTDTSPDRSIGQHPQGLAPAHPQLAGHGF